ncbi:unnamed protein product [Onchocerca ochengi]|uniref:ATP-dependent DNA helicase n=1 Tax=Onchocerca ochengi TaxID=42157 RepID=A0A182E5Z0_ONCOC|nr:unnamed protein product [Onchocerca ochengi]
MRRIIANQTEGERASANERIRQRMAQMRAKRCETKLEDVRLRTHRPCTAASDLLRSQQNQRRRPNLVVEHEFLNNAPGGTGKTFLIRLILAAIRSQNAIILAFASSGTAATLLPRGRTAHSALKLPLSMQFIETSTCNISEISGMGKSNIQSEAVTYKSVDTIVEADEAVNYPTEFSNSLDLLGMPLHVLQLKIGMPFIMLRNIN